MKILIYPQYGPVNTYIMQATFYARMGKIGKGEMECDDTPSSFKWPGYSIEDFKKEWEPEQFK